MATTLAVTLPKLTVTADTVALTIARLREFVTSSVSNSSLQILVDAAYLAIDDAIGPQGDVKEFFTVHGDLIMLSRRAVSITAVSENVRWAALALAADDYELRPSGQMLVRLRTGTNPRWYWQGRVDVTYRPPDDTANRVRVAIDLVKLDIATNPGLASQSIGTWAEAYTSNSAFNYALERQSILASLSPGIGIW